MINLPSLRQGLYAVTKKSIDGSLLQLRVYLQM